MDETYLSRHRVQTFAFANHRLLSPEAMPGGFETPEGERCVRLVPLWESLFSDLEALGPVAVITHNPGVMLGGTLASASFLPVPNSGEFVEQHSGQVIDSGRLTSVLAVEESKCGGSLFSLQFFDATGRGEFKLLLTTDADLHHFLEIVQHYALDVPRHPPVAAPEAPALISDSLVSIPAAEARALWPHLRHAIPGRWLPGRPGASRLDALPHLGRAVAVPLSSDALFRVVLAARRNGWPLIFGLDRGEQRQEVTLIPRWIESCADTLHLFDRGAEIHLFPECGGALWRVRWPREWALEWFDPTGERLLTVHGPPAEAGLWDLFLSTLS